MKWKKRKAELARLRKSHPVVSVGSIPRLLDGGGSKYPSLSSTGVSKICDRRGPSLPPPSGLIVGTPHKQGPMVMSKEELPWAGGKKS